MPLSAKPALLVVALAVAASLAGVAAAETPAAFAVLSAVPRPAALRSIHTRPPAVRSAVMQLPSRQGSSSGGSAVLDKPAPLKSPEVEEKVGKDKMYHVLLFNDPVNTREYVSKIIVETFGHTKSKAYDIMNHAHTTGFAVCITTSKEEADDGAAKLTDANLMSSVVEANGNED
eukprot:Tamp_29810.p2 GENE.Tamp_29810~~Tamp_29810.p2  ORF type:complete len:174 (+),score=49.04 Tamp_29810:185-706(+)